MADRVASTTAYSSSLVLVLGSLSLNEWALLCGIIIGFATYFTNLYYKHQMLKVARNKGVNIAKDDE